MQWRLVVAGLGCAAGAFLFLAGSEATSSDKKVAGESSALPARLSQFYPPASPAPHYLLAMLGMAQSFSGVISDLQENDLDNARKNFEAFKSAYVESAHMVPEWTDRYPLEPVEQMAKALAVGNPAEIMPAAQAVGQVCHSCHVTQMAPVQYRYRWPNFGDIALTDPVSGQDADFARLMLMMETSFDGIANNLKQGQVENARAQFTGFQARFHEMSQACAACHDSERHYFVSTDVTDNITKLGAELNKEQVDPEPVEQLLRAIGQESCAKCHLVHIPAAYAQQTAAHATPEAPK